MPARAVLRRGGLSTPPLAVVQLDAVDLAGAHEWDAGTGITRVRPHDALRARLALRRASQSRLDVAGKDIGPFVLAAGQPDFAALFGAANAQACARCLLFRGGTALTAPYAACSCSA